MIRSVSTGLFEAVAPGVTCWLLSTGLKFYLIQLSVIVETQEYSPTSPTPRLDCDQRASRDDNRESRVMAPQYLQLRGLLHLRRPKGAGATELLQLRLQLTCRQLSLGGWGVASGPIQKQSDRA